MPAAIASQKPTPNKGAVVARAKTNIALPADLREELGAEALMIKERIGAPSGDQIYIDRNKAFRLPDGTTGKDLSVIILDWVTMNKFYEGKFNDKDIKPPVCAAIGLKEKELIPTPTAPKKQAESCYVCPQNQWGSDGRGKACKNTRVLAVIATDVVNDGPIMLLNVSPMGLKNVDAYLAQFAVNPDCPHPLGVVTHITFDETKDYPCLVFDVQAANDGATIEMAARRRKQARTRLLTDLDLGGTKVAVADTK